MTALADAADTAPAHDDAHEHDHPTELTYWKVGLVLFILTALETSTYWWPKEWHRFTHVAIVVMMAIKFFMVAAFFMHLKYDSKLLRRVFITGFVLAVAVYGATLSAMVFWYDSGTERFPSAPYERTIPPKPTDPPTTTP